MKKAINVLFPHQLIAKTKLLQNGHPIYLIEEYLFFNIYGFHKQKIAFHRASMKAFEAHLKSQGHKVFYISSEDELSDIRNFIPEMEKQGVTKIHLIDPVDNWLEKRIETAAKSIKINTLDNPIFLTPRGELQPFFRSDKKSFFQTTFYKQQRQKLGILLDDEGNPKGGKWTYDSENRKKYPKGKNPPAIHFPNQSEFWDEAVTYTQKYFAKNPGELSKSRLYPITYQEASDWLDQFLEYRFYDFGAYEDAIVREASFLNHSVLSPLMNVGLIPADEVLERSLAFAKANDIPINSTEGFVRQIIGWREFIRGLYTCKGTFSRTTNFWGFDRKIPASFYDGTTGIDPIDQTIKKVLETGYCHHIERLMVLGNFMLLCQFDPDEVYRWFMELFIDAYDWVMVPNVYGMTQFADGGLFATKPYVGGSNYIRKMSNYSSGDWEAIWDGLFWNFIDQHQDFFKKNPRTSMLCYSFERMSPEKRTEHLKHAADFFAQLDA